ncbi:MAG TPA: hypothetical protein PK435_16145, partial [Thermoanaerobaculaceae bacterium]|nr:hypothetical protein [Thermoanaerobaculaceae bacterium]
MNKHHPINYSVSKDDAGSSASFSAATRPQRLFQALKGLTGDTCGAQELVDCWAAVMLMPVPGTDHQTSLTLAYPGWFTDFLADCAIRKPSPHTMKAYRQDFEAIA